MFPSIRLSSTPVTVAVCGDDQLPEVKVMEAGSTVPSVVSELESATVTLVVNKATPTITWEQPAAIYYGTVLSAAQLKSLHGEVVSHSRILEAPSGPKSSWNDQVARRIVDQFGW